MKHILVMNGPNLNLLGTREPDKYGTVTLEEIENDLRTLAKELGVDVGFFQSNHEGALIDRIHEARENADVLILNAGALTHTSIGLRDAIAGTGIKTIEVHLSNIYQREDFRHTSHIAPVAIGQISGLGPDVYSLALRAASKF